jgi:D-alanyl-D-alanine dipeptidase
MKIPQFEMPGMNNGTNFVNEDLIDIKKHFGRHIAVIPQYYTQGIPGSINKCLARETVIAKLEIAMTALPKNLTFAIFDAWRPIAVQQYLFDDFYNRIKKENKNLDDDKLLALVTKYAALPSTDMDLPSPHNSGGALDLTLYDKKQKAPLNMGTKFDSLSEKAQTDYYETQGSDEVRVNRRLLYEVMINAGFTNLPSEWWHYDYGDSSWSYYTGKPMMYRGIVET